MNPGKSANRLPWPPLDPQAHKGVAGRVEALVGSTEMPGAALLVARAAQRAGAGLVTVLCADAELLQVLPPAVPEAVWRAINAGQYFETLVSIAEQQASLRRTPHARVAGCGLGNTDRSRGLIGELLRLHDDIPLILDADGLNVLGDQLTVLAECQSPLVLTPHPGEASRLLGVAIPKEEAGRVAAANELAYRTNSIVCLKGAGTVISNGQRSIVNRSGCPGLATAGAGDVLTGILGAYIARARASNLKCDLFALAALAVRVHGLAGEAAARTLGDDALIASDLIEQLGPLQRELRASADN